MLERNTCSDSEAVVIYYFVWTPNVRWNVYVGKSFTSDSASTSCLTQHSVSDRQSRRLLRWLSERNCVRVSWWSSLGGSIPEQLTSRSSGPLFLRELRIGPKITQFLPWSQSQRRSSKLGMSWSKGFLPSLSPTLLWPASEFDYSSL